MGIAVSIVLVAVGAVLVWAVNASVSGIELDTVGVILLVVGAAGLLMTLVVSSRMPWRREADREERWVIDR